MSEKAPESGRLRTQRAIINSSLYWGLPLHHDTHSLPQFSPIDSGEVGSADQNTRMIRLSTLPDGLWDIVIDPAIPPAEDKEG